VEREKILYVGRVGMPTDAAGIRIYNIAKILREIGYDVDFICDREDSSLGETLKQYDGFTYSYNRSKERPKLLRVMGNFYELVVAKKVFARVKDYCERNNPAAIILYNDLYSLTKQLIKYGKKNDIKLIADVTEWYEKRKSKNLSDKIVPYFTDKRIKKLDKKVHNVISISPYLHNYYSNLGCNTILIPPIINVPTELDIKKHNYYSDYVLNLVYAGSQGSKDVLWPILNAIEIINSEKIKVRIDLVGIDYMDLKDNWKDICFEDKAIIAHGRLPHEKTLKIVKDADFGVLLRHNKRYAKAGFSTKFAECMSYGVPMICNSVGGAESIIDSMNNGVVIDNFNVDTLSDILDNLIQMDKNNILKIRKNAYEKAKLLYNGTNYKTTFSNFLRE